VKFILPGGSGHVGAVLARAFHAEGHDVVVLSRRPRSAPWRVIGWDGRTPGPWADELDTADVVINLAGRSVDCRYTPAHRREIMDSRIDSTRVLGRVIAGARRPPAVWLQASTATIYAHRLDAPNDEATGFIGGSEPGAPDTWRFSIDVATAWERAFDEAVVPATRKVAMRSAIIMSPDRGSAFDLLLGLVRRGLGGTSGDGRQFVSWIHDEDFVRAVRWLIDRREISGAVNLASPNPLTNAEFMRALRKAWGIPIGLPAPRWLLEIGTWALRTESELVLKSRRVVPRRLLDAGFTFDWPDWKTAAKSLVQKWRAKYRA
jgi:hypothetical protein